MLDRSGGESRPVACPWGSIEMETETASSILHHHHWRLQGITSKAREARAGSLSAYAMETSAPIIGKLDWGKVRERERMSLASMMSR